MAGLQSDVEYKQFRLQRAQVELNPVFATTMHTTMDRADHQWGYVRLVSFSQHAPADMHRAISQLKVRRGRRALGRVGMVWLQGRGVVLPSAVAPTSPLHSKTGSLPLLPSNLPACRFCLPACLPAA